MVAMVTNDDAETASRGQCTLGRPYHSHRVKPGTQCRKISQVKTGLYVHCVSSSHDPSYHGVAILAQFSTDGSRCVGSNDLLSNERHQQSQDHEHTQDDHGVMLVRQLLHLDQASLRVLQQASLHWLWAEHCEKGSGAEGSCYVPYATIALTDCTHAKLVIHFWLQILYTKARLWASIYLNRKLIIHQIV